MPLSRKPPEKTLVIIRADRHFLVDNVVHIFPSDHCFILYYTVLAEVLFPPDFTQKKCPLQEHTFQKTLPEK
jgi:hypothetical protein